MCMIGHNRSHERYYHMKLRINVNGNNPVYPTHVNPCTLDGPTSEVVDTRNTDTTWQKITNHKTA